VIGPSRPDPLGVTYDDEDGRHTIIRAAIDVGPRFSPVWAIPTAFASHSCASHREDKMANYYGVARTNYFAVVDQALFADFCDRWGVEAIADDGDPALVGFLCTGNDDGFPVGYRDEDGDLVEADIAAALAPLLVEGYIAVGMESGHEAFRYVAGVAWAVNSRGEVRSVTLDDIYDQARALGSHVTEAVY